jgi:predicted nucleic acid-binding protein
VIVLDTNVLAELVRREPAEAVVRWLTGQRPASIFVTAITQAEMLSSVESVPSGKRRIQLAGAIGKIFTEEFAGRILPFDEEVAPVYARIVSDRRRAGRPISQLDAMIAAIARTRSASVATRNGASFAGCGIALVNPWV